MTESDQDQAIHSMLITVNKLMASHKLDYVKLGRNRMIVDKQGYPMTAVEIYEATGFGVDYLQGNDYIVKIKDGIYVRTKE